MSLRIHLHLQRLRHRLLRTISPTYRESSDLQLELQSERAEHARTSALLHNTETSLAQAQSQIQSLTISAQSAAAEALRLRDERDTAREQSITYLDRLTNQHQPVMDWIAQGCPRHPIYGAGPQIIPQAQANPDSVPIGGVHGRKMAQSINSALLEKMRKDIISHELPDQEQEVAV